MWGAVFPGQGSQSVGMGRFLFEEFAIARRTFEEASDAVGTDFKKLCFDGPEAQLQLTENTQPALVLVSTACFRVVGETLGLGVTAGAGHSVGEYSALVAAHAMGFPDAIRAVRRRGQEMQKAVPVGQGAMAAVLGLGDEAVRALCAAVVKESGEAPLEPANFNSPGQVVVSGSAKAVEWMRTHVKQEWVTAKLGPDAGRVKLIPLNVSAPFHCSLMRPAETAMREVLQTLKFQSPRFAVVQNLTAAVPDDTDTIRENLIGQISGAVLWTQCQEALLAKGINRFIEFGAGKVLAGLAKKIAGDRAQVFGLNSLDDLKALERNVQ